MRHYFTIATLISFFLLPVDAHTYWEWAHKEFADNITDANKILSSNEVSLPHEDYYSTTLGFPLTNNYTYNDLIKIRLIPFIEKTEGLITEINWDAVKSGEEIFIDGADDEDYPVTRTANHFIEPYMVNARYRLFC